MQLFSSNVFFRLLLLIRFNFIKTFLKYFEHFFSMFVFSGYGPFRLVFFSHQVHEI